MASRKTTKKRTAPKKQTLSRKTANVSTSLKNEAMNPAFSPMQRITPGRRRLYIGIVVVALLLLVAFALKGYLIAAMVNGQPVSRLEVISQLEKQGGKQVLSSLVQNALILQEAKERGVELTQDDISKYLAKIDERLKSQGQTLEQAMKAYGITKEEVIKEQTPNMLLEKMSNNGISVSDKEVQDFIDQNNEAYGGTLKAADVKTQLYDQKLSQKQQELLDSLQKDAKIDYYVTY